MIFNLRLLVLCIFNLINTGIIIGFIINNVCNRSWFYFLLYLTNINLLLCTIYLYLVIIYEILDKTNNKYYLFVIRRLGKLVFTLCWSVVFSYWMYTLMGDDVLPWPDNSLFILFTVYIHFIIGIIIVFEFFTCKTRHYVKGLFYKDLFILSIFVAIYFIILSTIGYKIKISGYNFLNKSYVNVIGYTSVSIMNYIVSYLLYYSLARRFNSGVLELQEIGIEDRELIRDINN